MGKGADGVFYIVDSVRGKWLPGERDKIIRRTAEKDGKYVPIQIEQEGGSGGIAQVHSLVTALAGYRVEGVRATGSKEVRASPFASQVNVGNVKMVKAPWNADLLGEMEAFPTGEYSDQEDAMGMAFGYLVDRGGGMSLVMPPRGEEDDLEGESSFVRNWRNDRDLFPASRRPGSKYGHWSKEFPG